MMSTMQQPQQGNEEVVTGQVTAVIAKGGDKWQIAVQPQGSQYTKNLWTKDFGLVQQMQANINSWYSFICGASHWTNQQGQNVRSLWVNSVTAPGMAPQPNGPQAAAQQQQQPQGAGQPNWQPASAAAAQPQGQPGISPMEKEERIMREHAMGVVALMLPHMAPEERNAPAMIDVAEGLVAYYRLGRQAISMQPGGPNPAYVPQPQYNDGPPNPGGGSDYHPGYASYEGDAHGGGGSEDWPTPAPGQSDDIPY